MTDARPGLSGGWAHGPCEAWAFAMGLSSGNDRDKRMAMLAVDNAAELALKTYLSLHPRQRGGPKIPMDTDPNFASLIDGFETCFPAWPPGTSRAELLWMHDVRNTLHHRGNGLTPDEAHLRRYLDAVEVLLRFLFGDAPVEDALTEQRLPVPSPQSRAAPLPAIIDEVDRMIVRIRRRVEQMPSGAPPASAIPSDTLDLALRAVEVIGDAAVDWDPDLVEQMSDYSDWLWEIDGVPENPDEAIAELEKLRYELAVALL